MQPLDEHNRRWVGHVRPHDWKNPQPRGRYNLLVVGAGPAGLVAAAGAAGLGAKVALVEKQLMGGDCLNVGCVPSKAVLRAARVAAEAGRAAAFGVSAADVAVDFPAVMQRMRRLRADLSRHDSAQRFRDELGIDVYLGDGRFTAEDAFEIDGRTLRFARACIATGARAAEPATPGLADVGYLTNETVFTLTELPRRVAVIGAGPIGCELAQAFARLGSTVHLIEAAHGILPREDRDAAAIVQQALTADGVTLLCCGKQLEAAKHTGGIALSVEAHEPHHDRDERHGYKLVVDQVLVGVGRKPNVEGLGLDAAGVKFDDGNGIEVNDYLQTTNRRIYAAGDCCSKFKFTHAADAMARLVLRNALFFGRGKVSDLVIPWCTFTEPELAHVGLTAQQARDEGHDVRTQTIDLGSVDRAVLDGQSNGFVRIHHTPGGAILGATIVAANAGDMMATLSLALRTGRKLSDIADTILPYPTQAEAIRKAADAYNRTRLTPRVKNLFETLLKWRR